MEHFNRKCQIFDFDMLQINENKLSLIALKVLKTK